MGAPVGKRAVSAWLWACQAEKTAPPRIKGGSDDQGSLVYGGMPPYMHSMERGNYFSAQSGREIVAPPICEARFSIGEVVRHKMFDFRGVIFDIDPVFANSEDWYQSIPENVRPNRDQPFYHLLAENGENSYVAYVSQQNLVTDAEAGPVDHPSVTEMFEAFRDGRYRLRRKLSH
jgi:heat shock protein HspQ